MTKKVTTPTSTNSGFTSSPPRLSALSAMMSSGASRHHSPVEACQRLITCPGVTEVTHSRCRASLPSQVPPPMTKLRGLIKTRLPVTAWVFAALGVLFSLLYTLMGGHGVGQVQASMTHLL